MRLYLLKTISSALPGLHVRYSTAVDVAGIRMPGICSREHASKISTETGLGLAFQPLRHTPSWISERTLTAFCHNEGTVDPDGKKFGTVVRLKPICEIC